MKRRSTVLTMAFAMLLLFGCQSSDAPPMEVDSSVGADQAASGTMPSLPRFDAAPQIGEPLPDLTIVDDQGNPVNIRELARENYAVLVLGCLT